MNINSEFSSSDNDLPNAESVMAKGMGFIAEKLIEPMEGKLEEDDLKLLALIGISFKIVAEQARAYEEIMGQAQSQDNSQDFFRN